MLKVGSSTPPLEIYNSLLRRHTGGRSYSSTSVWGGPPVVIDLDGSQSSSSEGEADEAERTIPLQREGAVIDDASPTDDSLVSEQQEGTSPARVLRIRLRGSLSCCVRMGAPVSPPPPPSATPVIAQLSGIVKFAQHQAAQRQSEHTCSQLVLAADHHIPKVDEFTAAVGLGRVATSQYICTFGVTPTSPETG